MAAPPLSLCAAVSYTHLDVYKRQAVQRACGLLTLALEEGVEQRIALFVGVAAVVERAAGCLLYTSRCV